MPALGPRGKSQGPTGANQVLLPQLLFRLPDVSDLPIEKSNPGSYCLTSS